jgi:glutaredoxin
MSEPALRVLVIAAAALVSVSVVLVFRALERRRVQRAPLDLSGLSRPVTLFTDAGCSRCDQARDMLADAGVEFEEIRFDHHPDIVAEVGVTGVPLVVARAPDGTEIDRIAGRVTRRALRRLLARVG